MIRNRRSSSSLKRCRLLLNPREDTAGRSSWRRPFRLGTSGPYGAASQDHFRAFPKPAFPSNLEHARAPYVTRTLREIVELAEPVRTVESSWVPRPRPASPGRGRPGRNSWVRILGTLSHLRVTSVHYLKLPFDCLQRPPLPAASVPCMVRPAIVANSRMLQTVPACVGTLAGGFVGGGRSSLRGISLICKSMKNNKEIKRSSEMIPRSASPSLRAGIAPDFTVAHNVLQLPDKPFLSHRFGKSSPTRKIEQLASRNGTKAELQRQN